MELTIKEKTIISKPKLERTNTFSIYDIQEELQEIEEESSLYISDGEEEIEQEHDKEILNEVITEPEVITDNEGFTYTKVDLTEDGVLSIEAQLRRIKYLDDKQNILIKDYGTNMKRKVLSICLNKLGLDIMTNTYSLKQSKREELQKLMWEYNGKDEETINNDFYKACLDQELFDRDYTRYPIYA